MADRCFLAVRRPVDADIPSQLAWPHVVPLRPGKGAADRRLPPRLPSRTAFQRRECLRFHARIRLLATRSPANTAQPRG
jgi:hypothetical protein